MIARTMGLWVIGATILMGSLLVSFNAQAEEEVVLKCEPTDELTKDYHDFFVSIKGGKIKFREEFKSGYSEQFYTISQKNSEKVVGVRTMPNGEPSRIEINRVTGFMRVNYRISDEDKENLWNEKEKKIGFPKDEEIWMGFSARCRSMTKLF